MSRLSQSEREKLLRRARLSEINNSGNRALARSSFGLSEKDILIATKKMCESGYWPDNVRECLEDSECRNLLLKSQQQLCKEDLSDGPLKIEFSLSKFKRIDDRIRHNRITDADLDIAEYLGDITTFEYLNTVLKSKQKGQYKNIGNRAVDIDWDTIDNLDMDSFNKEFLIIPILYIALYFDWGYEENRNLLKLYEFYRYGGNLNNFAKTNPNSISSELFDFMVGSTKFYYLSNLSSNLYRLLSLPKTISTGIKHRIRPSMLTSKQTESRALFYFMRDTIVDFMVGDKTVRDLEKLADKAPGRFDETDLQTNPFFNKNPDKLPLLQVVKDQLETWIKEPDSFPNNLWLEGAEGQIYIRHIAGWKTRFTGASQLDLASFSIKPKFQRQGISKSIIDLACSMPFKIVKIELIHDPNWSDKIKNYNYPDRKIEVEDHGYDGVVSIRFIKI